MAYMALYRKWRPGGFSELVGQEHVSRTLSNAIKTGRIGHAYLFAALEVLVKPVRPRFWPRP